VFGGLVARVAKVHILVGFILAGVVFKILLPGYHFNVEDIAQLGLIFLLFTTGLDLSLARLSKVFKVSLVGALLQITLVSIFCIIILRLFYFDLSTAIILSLGFSLSSTAVVVKLLNDRGEADSVHGEVMIGWLLMQDLIVVPILFAISLLGKGTPINFGVVAVSIFKVSLVVFLVVALGKNLLPKLLNWVSSFNLRELVFLISVLIALGTAILVSFFGVSASIGAFLAGIVLAESVEKYAVFAEIRPLRDLFVAIFFVSLGLLITPSFLAENIGVILAIFLAVLVIKFVVNLVVSLGLSYHGKAATYIAVGLSQIGEFSFIIYSQALVLGLISQKAVTVGVSAALFSLVVFPAFYKKSNAISKALKSVFMKNKLFSKYFRGWDKEGLTVGKELEGHIIICGYGRVGGWVGRALDSFGVRYIVVEYNLSVAREIESSGGRVIYGDPSEREVLEAAGISTAKAIVIAIPDRQVQESIITIVQTTAPNLKIISRVHKDEDFERVKSLKVDKIVQPEFEAAVAIIRSMLVSMGKSKEEINKKISSLRHNHSLRV